MAQLIDTRTSCLCSGSELEEMLTTNLITSGFRKRLKTQRSLQDFILETGTISRNGKSCQSEPAKAKVPLFPWILRDHRRSPHDFRSGDFSVLAHYRIRFPEPEEIDVMRLIPDLPFKCQTWPVNATPIGGPTGFSADAYFEKAGWTEMVIPGNPIDSRVFLIAGTSLKNASGGRITHPEKSGPADQFSLQAIKR